MLLLSTGRESYKIINATFSFLLSESHKSTAIAVFNRSSAFPAPGYFRLITKHFFSRTSCYYFEKHLFPYTLISTYTCIYFFFCMYVWMCGSIFSAPFFLKVIRLAHYNKCIWSILSYSLFVFFFFKNKRKNRYMPSYWYCRRLSCMWFMRWSFLIFSDRNIKLYNFKQSFTKMLPNLLYTVGDISITGNY